MKSYLDLIPISAKVHKRQNRMSIFCIVLAVLLVTVIFEMADMFIRSQLIQTRMEDGNCLWGELWNIPLIELGIILAIVIVSVFLAVQGPVRRIRKMSIVETISAE